MGDSWMKGLEFVGLPSEVLGDTNIGLSCMH